MISEIVLMLLSSRLNSELRLAVDSKSQSSGKYSLQPQGWDDDKEGKSITIWILCALEF